MLFKTLSVHKETDQRANKFLGQHHMDLTAINSTVYFFMTNLLKMPAFIILL